MAIFTEEMIQLLKSKTDECRAAGFDVPQPVIGRITGNKIPIYPNNSNIWPEFGDFRLTLKKHHIAVELDGNGIDLTNLIKHWHYLCEHFDESPVNGKPVILLHVYTQKIGDDLRSRVIWWNFLYRQILQNLPREGVFEAFLYPVRIEDPENREQDKQAFLKAFAAYLYKANTK